MEHIQLDTLEEEEKDPALGFLWTLKDSLSLVPEAIDLSEHPPCSTPKTPLDQDWGVEQNTPEHRVHSA